MLEHTIFGIKQRICPIELVLPSMKRHEHIHKHADRQMNTYARCTHTEMSCHTADCHWHGVTILATYLIIMFFFFSFFFVHTIDRIVRPCVRHSIRASVCGVHTQTHG